MGYCSPNYDVLITGSTCNFEVEKVSYLRHHQHRDTSTEDTTPAMTVAHGIYR